MAGYFDKNKDYSKELMRSDLSTSERERLTQERQNKIDAVYSGKEPTLDGSNKTYSEVYGSSSNGGSGKSSGSSSGNSSSGGGSGNKRTMPDGFQGSATDVNVWDDDQSAIRDEMNRNSQLWHTADDAERERLHARNLALAKLLNENGGDVSFDDASGTWGGSAGSKQQQSPVQGGGFSNPSAPKYDNRYDEKLNEIVDEILQRDPFSYSAANDPLYKYYQGQYERNGDKAMRDTLGQVAARTGGLGSSYAGSAAQQQYNDYMQGLNDIVPELYKLAYSMYQDEADTQRANAEMLQALEAGDYAKFQDLLAQYNTDRNFNYGVFRDALDFGYQQQRDSISDARYNSEWEYKKNADADNLLLEYAKLAKKNSSGSSSSGSGSTQYDYEGLFRAAQASGNPKSWLAQKGNYSKYGFTSSSGLYADYQAWEEENGGADGEIGSDGSGLSESASRILASLEKMRNQMGSAKGIENSIAIYADQGKLTDAEARYLFEYFGYDPDDWLE